MKLFELYAELGLDSSGFDKGVRKASKSGSSLAGTLRQGIGGASDYVGTKISATTIALGNLMADAAKKGAQLVKDTAKSGIQYNASMETYITNFTTMLGGSSEAAKQLTTDLEDMAASTPFAMQDLAGATNTLLAFGQSSDTVLDTLQSLGDISMGDAGKLQSLTLAFAQASSSGKLMGQDLMQMINAGFNPLQTIVDKTGASMGDLKEFMSSGKASAALKKQMREAKREVKALGDNASEGAKMLVQMSQEGAISADLLGQIFEIETSPGGRFYNAMKAASETFEGLVSTLQDDTTALLGKVFKPISDWMTNDLLPKTIGAIGEIGEAIDEGGLSAGVKKAVEVAGALLDDLSKSAMDVGSSLLADVLSGITGDTTSADEIKKTLGGLFSTAKDNAKDFVDTAGGTLIKIWQAMKIGDNAASISKLASSIWDDASKAVSTFISEGGAVLAGILEGMNNDPSGEPIVKKFEDLYTAAKGFITPVIDTGKTIFSTIYTGLTGEELTAEEIGKKIGEAFRGGIDGITDVLTAAGNLMRDINGALNGDPQSIDELKTTLVGVFNSAKDGMDGVIEYSSDFLSRLYAKITGDTEGAEKLRGFLAENLENPVEEGAEFFDKTSEGAKAWGDIFAYIGDKVKGWFEENKDGINNALQKAGDFLAPFIEGSGAEPPDWLKNARAWANGNLPMQEMEDYSKYVLSFTVENMKKNALTMLNPWLLVKNTAEGVSDLGVMIWDELFGQPQKAPNMRPNIPRSPQMEFDAYSSEYNDPYAFRRDRLRFWGEEPMQTVPKPGGMSMSHSTPDLSGFGGASIREMLEEKYGGQEGLADAIAALQASIAALQSSSEAMPGEAASAAAAAISGAKVEMDGHAVGRIVLPYVSAGIYRQSRQTTRVVK